MSLAKPIVATLLVVTCALSACRSQPALPARADCIVKFVVNWSGYDPQVIEQANRRLSELMRRDDLGAPIAGLVVGSGERYEYFIQYYRQCDRRLVMTEELVRRWAPTVSVVVDAGRVEPSIRTIEVTGRAWRD